MLCNALSEARLRQRKHFHMQIIPLQAINRSREPEFILGGVRKGVVFEAKHVKTHHVCSIIIIINDNNLDIALSASDNDCRLH